MTAPTSRMTPEPADPNDLRADLTKLADKTKARVEEYARGGHWMGAHVHSLVEQDLRALLAAHPAPETDEGDGRHVLFNRVPFPPECSCGTRMPDGNVQDNFNQHLVDVAAHAPVSDARREDVGLGLIEAHVAEFEASIARLEASIQDPNNTVGGREYDTAKLHGQRGAVYALRRLADALAVLPAPPVVDETVLRDLILKVDDEGGWSNIFPDEATALAAAIARLRGATRG